MEPLAEERSNLQDIQEEGAARKHNSLTPVNEKAASPGGDDGNKPVASSNAAGGSFKTLMLAKRMSKRLSISQGSRRRSSVSGSENNMRRHQIRLEPTYRMEPRLRFDAAKVNQVMEELLNRKLEGFTYQAKIGAIYSRSLSEELKARVKELGFDRYKIISTIFLIENSGQSEEVCSRFLWDTKVDNFVTYTYKSEKVICIANVYGVYHE